MTLEVFVASIPNLLGTCLRYIKEFLPYLLIGILLGELLKFTSWTKIVYVWVTKSPFLAVVSASIMGIVSPLCTYGTIPVVLELYRGGVHVAPLVAFLSASSLMNPQLLVMTMGGLGFEMGLVRLASVFLFSVALGLLCYLVPTRFIIKKSIERYGDGGERITARGKKLFIVRTYLINCLKNLRHVGFYLLIGILIGAAVEMYIPTIWIENTFRAGRIQSILAAALLGVPMYACGGGAIPAVRSMMHQGMSKGSALAFFIVGPATRPEPLLAMAALFTPLFLVGYCLFLIIASVCMGLIWDLAGILLA